MVPSKYYYCIHVVLYRLGVDAEKTVAEAAPSNNAKMAR